MTDILLPALGDTDFVRITKAIRDIAGPRKYYDFIDTGSAPPTPATGRKRLYFDDEQLKAAVPSGTLGGPYHIPTYTTGSITVSTTDNWLDIITRHQGGRYIYFNDGTYDFSVAATGTISAASWSGGSATITHNGGTFIAGESVTISGVGNAGYNGTFTITSSDDDTFTYAVADPSGASSGGTAAGRKASSWSPENTGVLLKAVNVGGAILKNLRIIMKGKYVLLWGFDILPPDDGTYWFSIGYGSGLECYDCCMDISSYYNQTSGIGFTTLSDFKFRSFTRDSVWDFGDRVTAQAFDIDSSSAIKVGWTSVTRTTTSGSWSGGTATILHNGSSNAFIVGSSVVVSGVTPSGYNGTHVVTASSNGSFSFAVADPGGVITVQGSIAASTKNKVITTNGVVQFIIDTSNGIITRTEFLNDYPDPATHAVTGASGNGTTVTLTHDGSNSYPVGSLITVAGVTPAGYNGTGFEVTASSAGSVSFLDAEVGAYVSGGTIVPRASGTALITRRNTGIVLANNCLVKQFDVGLRSTGGQSPIWTDTTRFESNVDAVYTDGGGVAIVTDTNTFVSNNNDITNASSGAPQVSMNGSISASGLGVSASMRHDVEFVGEISGTTLTVSSITTSGGVMEVGQRIYSGATAIEFNSVIELQLTGSTGSTGTYQLNNSQTISAGTTMYAVPGLANVMRFTDTDTSASPGQPLGAVEYYGTDGSTGGPGVKAYVAAITETIGSDADLIFGTSDNSSTQQARERVRIKSDGKVGIGTKAPTRLLDIADDGIRVRTAKTPASAAATGNAGDICWDSSYIYICTATDTWKRVAIATW